MYKLLQKKIKFSRQFHHSGFCCKLFSCYCCFGCNNSPNKFPSMFVAVFSVSDSISIDNYLMLQPLSFLLLLTSPSCAALSELRLVIGEITRLTVENRSFIISSKTSLFLNLSYEFTNSVDIFTIFVVLIL